MVTEGNYDRIELSGDHARKLAAALIAAADEAEKMAGYDEVTILT
jgi:hypothetical protein